MIGVVFPTESDATILYVYQPTIGNGNTMGVPRKIFQYNLRISKRCSDIDDPIVPNSGIQHLLKPRRIAE